MYANYIMPHPYKVTPRPLQRTPLAFDVLDQPTSLTPADARLPGNALPCHHAIAYSFGQREH